MYKILRQTQARHEGGTKFYELVLIERQDTRQHFVIRRYGKIEVMLKNGGATMIENVGGFKYDQLQRSKAASGYNFMDGRSAFNVPDGTIVDGKHVERVYAFTGNYDTIRNLLGVGSTPAFTGSSGKSIPNPMNPEPKRPEGWGAW